MENLKIGKSEITWETNKLRYGGKIKYKSRIIKHDDHISIMKEMYVNDKLKRQDLTHIPLELIEHIKKLT